MSTIYIDGFNTTVKGIPVMLKFCDYGGLFGCNTREWDEWDNLDFIEFDKDWAPFSVEETKEFFNGIDINFSDELRNLLIDIVDTHFIDYKTLYIDYTRKKTIRISFYEKIN